MTQDFVEVGRRGEGGMLHEPCASLDELLAPAMLTRLAHEQVSTVRSSPFSGGDSASGSQFLTIETNEGQGPRFVVKLSSPACDWIVRATGDELGREVLVWSSGLLDRLPPEIIHPVVACARNENGWAILMRDVSEALIPESTKYATISLTDHRRYLDALAALHTTFWNESGVDDPGDRYCSLRHLYTATSPATGKREVDHPNAVLPRIRNGWDLFWTVVAPDVAELLQRLFEDPGPLCDALARYPRTIVHGDPRAANLGIMRKPRPRVVLIDWHFVSSSTPGADVAWYLWALGSRLPIARETTISWYRDRLAHRLGARFDETWWQPVMDLSLLGQLMRGGCWLAIDAVQHQNPAVRAWNREELAWWSERAGEGERWL
jgi:hypothetical protein